MSLVIGKHVSRGLALTIHSIAIPIMLAGLPWAQSLLGVRHGWIEDRPGVWNLAGIIPVAAGFLGMIWTLSAHFIEAPGGWTIEKPVHYPTPSYLLVNGPYRYSRNPMYLAEGVIWLGWTVFYGSMVVLGVFLVMALIAGPVIVPREERGLETRLGEGYREYKRTVPRWLGRRRH